MKSVVKNSEAASFALARWPIPETWTWVHASQIARVVGGGTPPSGDPTNFCEPGKGIPWITPADLTGYRSTHIGHGRRNLSEAGLANCGAKVVPAGSVLLSSRAPIGYCAIATNPVATSQGFKSLVLADGVSPIFIRCYLRHSTEYLHSLASGTTFPEISGRKVGEIAIPLPPRAEQRRIVARLEALEARSRRARALLAEVPAQLAQARQSLLAAAFRGDLTAEWRATTKNSSSAAELLASLQKSHDDAPLKRGNAANASEGVHDLNQADFPSTWMVSELRMLCRPDRPICYGILMPGPEQIDGVPYVRVADFPRDFIRLETVRKTTAKIDAQFARSRLSTGDILLSIRGTTGRIAFVPPELDGANITQDSARLSIHPSVDARFVALMMRSPDTQRRMQRAVKGVAVRGLNIGDVRPLQIPLPPLPEQHEIVRRLSAALARLDAAARAHAAAVSELDRLDQSLLARAFSGTLVPQNPEDSPAAATLAQRSRTD